MQPASSVVPAPSVEERILAKGYPAINQAGWIENRAIAGLLAGERTWLDKNWPTELDYVKNL